MRDIDRDVEVLLDRMAAEAGEPGPLPAGMARRSARRRGGTIAGAALLVMGVLFGSMYLATARLEPGEDRRESSVAITSGPDDPATESNEQPPPESMKGDLVAQGETQGVRWWLTAYTDDNDDLCTEFFTQDESGGGGGGGCGPFDPERHPIGLGVQSGDGLASATGHVPLRVERLELMMRDGSSSPVIEFHDAPEGFDLPVKFYVLIPFPQDDAQELIAYDETGEVVGRQEVFNPNDEPKTSRVAGSFVIDEGEHQGIPYVFRGRVEEQRMDEGETWTYPCHEFMLGEGERYGGGGGCDIPLARGHDINFSQTSFETHPDIVAIHGGLRPGIDRVTVELDSGERFEARIFDVPETDFGFYLVFPDAPRDKGLSGEVVAYRGLKEVERLELCDAALTTVGGSCGP